MKYYSDVNDTSSRTAAENDNYALITRQILTYLNVSQDLFVLHVPNADYYDHQRCLQFGLCPKVVTEVPTKETRVNNVEYETFISFISKSIPAPLSETEQKELWSKYSTLVPYIPLNLPDDPKNASSDKAPPPVSEDMVLVSDGQSAPQSSITRKPEGSGSSSVSGSLVTVQSVQVRI